LRDVFGVDSASAEEGVIYENAYGRGKSIFIITPLGRYFLWAAQPWSNYSYKNEAESVRETFLQMIEKGNYSTPYEVDGNAVAMAYEKGNEKMLRILNFNGIKHGNAIPESQHIEIRIKGNVSNARLLNFMDGWKDVEVRKDGDYSIISFTLHTQANLVYEINGSSLYVSIEKPAKGKIYFMDRDILSISSDKAIVIGGITIEVETNGKRVEFYIDNELKYEDDEQPYSWTWDEFSFGRHKIKVVAYGGEEKAEDAMSVMKIL